MVLLIFFPFSFRVIVRGMKCVMSYKNHGLHVSNVDLLRLYLHSLHFGQRLFILYAHPSYSSNLYTKFIPDAPTPAQQLLVIVSL